MMSFQVAPDQVSSFGKLSERNGTNVSLVNVYLAGNTSLGSTDGEWLQMIVGAHNDTVTRMMDSLYRGVDALTASGQELKAVADYYRATDLNAEASLDSTYTTGERPPVESPEEVPTQDSERGPAHTGAGEDVWENPGDVLNEPDPPEGFSDPMILFNSVADLMSPAWWINQVLVDTIGCNPLEEINDLLIGDWEGLAKCADVWENASKSIGMVSDNVGNGLRWLAADWQGKAADAAVTYFDHGVRALKSHQEIFHELHNRYLAFARGVWNAARTLSDIVKMIFDTAVVAGLSLLAGVGLSWTGVGAGISWALAAAECARIMILWGEATQLISATQTTIAGFVGLLQSLDSGYLEDVKAVSMPASDYDHPGVERQPSNQGGHSGGANP